MTSAHEFHGPTFSPSADLAFSARRPDDALRHGAKRASLDTILQNLAEEARLLIGAHYAALRIAVDENWSQVVSASSVSEKNATWCAAHATTDGIGVDSSFFPISKPLRMTHAEMLAHPAWRAVAAHARNRPPMRGWLAVPLLKRNGSIFGFFDLTDKCQGDFDLADEHRLEQLAQIAALAVENTCVSSPYLPKDQVDDLLDNDEGEITDTFHGCADTLILTPQSGLGASRTEDPEDSVHAVITTDLDEKITGWNDGAEKLFGYARSAVLGQSIRMLVPSEKLAEHQEIMTVLRGNEISIRRDTVRQRADGTPIEIGLSVSALHDPDGTLRGAVLVAHDLAGSKRLGQQYRQAQRMGVLGHLAGGVAHDFNNLLTVILGYSEMLIHRIAPTDGAHELLTEIHTAGARAEALTRQLLAFCRKQVSEMKVLDLNAVVSDTEKMLRRLIGEDILMMTIFAPGLGRVKIDPSQMQQVILNLAVNARDAMPRGGRLTIETANVTLDEAYSRTHPCVRPGNFVMLALSDTGIGMNAATKARVFEPLFTTKGPSKGTGLGLAIVKNIVNLSGGHVEVYTELGRGTTFKVYLPQVQESVPATAPPSNLNTLPRGNETVLLVEDEDCVRKLARQVLEMCGYTVLEASHGEEALHLFETTERDIDLLVTDVVMPHLDGPSLADRLLATNRQLKVLFLSGYPDDAVIRHGILNTDVAFLQKPFTTSGLAQKVRTILDQNASAN